jgi:hypothetical protein
MIEPIKGKQTLAQSEIQDGDIITVQKSFSEKEYLLSLWNSITVSMLTTQSDLPQLLRQTR